MKSVYATLHGQHLHLFACSHAKACCSLSMLVQSLVWLKVCKHHCKTRPRSNCTGAVPLNMLNSSWLCLRVSSWCWLLLSPLPAWLQAVVADGSVLLSPLSGCRL